MAAASGSEAHRYGIGAVAKMTGLTDHTIRVWERRYDAVVTERAANGRRVYSAADVEKLGYLKRLTDQGFSIGQIASCSVEELRERLRTVSDMSSAAVPDEVGIAVLGDYLPGQLSSHERDLSPLQVRIADSNRGRFAADLRCQAIDVVILESPILNPEVSAQLVEYMDVCGADRGIIIYSFGRSRDVELARQPNVVVLRGPVDVDQVKAAVVRSFTQPYVAEARPEKRRSQDDSEWGFSGTVAPRLFNQQQLATLANTSSAIDCECPQHLAQLVGDLSAFEMYSANCENRNDADAALHRYLHQTTAQARALIEVALEKVAEAEGIRY
ncbi:MAG: MerR family transcriptional regulator [Gammaproteobacteria bacterium]|nr:MerR family transcriptional regulator [Gammaproteobacteria bacterium]